MWLTCVAPKKFLCRYPLSLGANLFGILMACVNIACIIVIAIEMIGFTKCESCTSSVLRCAYAFSGTAIIDCVIMVFVNLWFLWAIKRRKSSVVLIWIVVTSMWLMQSFCLTLVLLCMYMAKASFATWILSTVFGIIAFGIAAYGVTVGFGLWLDLKPLTRRNTANALNN